MRTRDSYWRLGGVVIDGHDGPETNHTVDEGYSLRVWLTPRSDTKTGEWPGHVDRFRQLRRYRPHAGAFAGGVDAKYRPWFREQHDRSPSLLVALRPPATSDTGLGMWALVDGCESNTTLPNTLCELEFDLKYLAELDEYDSERAARNAMEA